MKNSIKLFFLLLTAVGVSSCMKENDYAIYDREANMLKDAPILAEYVAATPGLEGAVLDPSGIWYVVLTEGVKPQTDTTAASNGYYKYNINNANNLEIPRISIEYEGRLVSSGVLFEEGTTEKLADDKLPYADGFIEGWVRTILPKSIVKDGKTIEIGGLTPLGLQKGTKIRVVIPSALAYQDRSSQKIPANASLDFTIEVFKVLPPLN